MESIGLVEIKPLLCKTEEGLIKKIAQKRGIMIGRVRKMMENNRWTVKQFADLTGKTTQAVHLYLKPYVNEDILDVKIRHCFPYPSKGNNGPIFVFRDSKSEKIIKDSLK